METAVVKAMAVVKGAVREVVSEAKPVVMPATEAVKPLVQRPVVRKPMMVPEKPMVAMDPDPVMVMSRMTESEGEPHIGRRRTWPGNHPERDQERPQDYQLSETFLHHMSLLPVLDA